MKQDIHPQYGPASIHCACGNVIETRSTHSGVIQVEICSACHPFFTGRQKLMDTAGRIDRFKKKFGDRVVGTQKKKKEAPPEPKPKAVMPKAQGLQGLKDKEKPAAKAK